VNEKFDYDPKKPIENEKNLRKRYISFDICDTLQYDGLEKAISKAIKTSTYMRNKPVQF
jgi:hypothetical protein